MTVTVSVIVTLTVTVTVTVSVINMNQLRKKKARGRNFAPQFTRWMNDSHPTFSVAKVLEISCASRLRCSAELAYTSIFVEAPFFRLWPCLVLATI